MNTQQNDRPKTIDEAMQTMAMTDEEAKLLEDETYEQGKLETGKTEKSALELKADNPPDPNAIPDWVVFPPGMKIPPGKQLGFMLFRAKWTDRPEKGDRHVILWPLSDADEKLAIKRARGEGMRSIAELSKQLLRAIDGHKVDWTGAMGPGNPERFWDEIGSKCRQLIQNYYVKTHALDDREQADFFLNCLVVRSSVVG